MSNTRYLVIAEESNWLHRVACDRGEDVVCGVIEMAPDIIVATVPGGTFRSIKLSDFDSVIIDSAELDRTSGADHRERLIDHLESHGLDVRELSALQPHGTLLA